MHKSENVYQLPLPADAEITRVVIDSPAHIGPYKGAIDIAVKVGTDVLAPLNGTVLTVVDNNTQTWSYFGVRAICKLCTD